MPSPLPPETDMWTLTVVEWSTATVVTQMTCIGPRDKNVSCNASAKLGGGGGGGKKGGRVEGGRAMMVKYFSVVFCWTGAANMQSSTLACWSGSDSEINKRKSQQRRRGEELQSLGCLQNLIHQRSQKNDTSSNPKKTHPHSSNCLE